MFKHLQESILSALFVHLQRDMFSESRKKTLLQSVGALLYYILNVTPNPCTPIYMYIDIYTYMCVYISMYTYIYVNIKKYICRHYGNARRLNCFPTTGTEPGSQSF